MQRKEGPGKGVWQEYLLSGLFVQGSRGARDDFKG